MKYITRTFHILAILLLLGVAGLFLASALPIPANIEIKVVKSGSMEPAIPVGALVIIKPVATYVVGDVITFGRDTKTEIPTTHRIVAIREANGSAWYTTKGDANEERDPKEVAAREVIGKVLATVPGAGYVLDFAKQPLGFALLIALPAGIIILDELLAIYREIRKRLRPKKGKGPDDGRAGSHLPKEPGSGGINMRNFHTEVRYIRRYATDDVFLPVRVRIRDVVTARQYTNIASSGLAVIVVFVMSSGGFGGTLSYFRDTETSSMNVFGAGQWETLTEEGMETEETFALEPSSVEESGAVVTEETPEGIAEKNEQEEVGDEGARVQRVSRPERPERPSRGGEMTDESTEEPAQEELPAETSAEEMAEEIATE